MSGESVVAMTSRDGRVRFIDMQSAQERPVVLIGHAASVRCIVVQEDKKRIFTVRSISLLHLVNQQSIRNVSVNRIGKL